MSVDEHFRNARIWKMLLHSIISDLACTEKYHLCKVSWIFPKVGGKMKVDSFLTLGGSERGWWTLNHTVLSSSTAPRTVIADAFSVLVMGYNICSFTWILIFQAFHRELRPLNKQSTPVEQLMESIRNSSIRSSLRKTSGPPPRPGERVTHMPENKRFHMNKTSSVGVSFLFESSRTGIEVSEDASLSGHSPSVVEKALPKRLEIRPAEERTMLDFEADLTDAEETDAESITSGGGGLLSRQTSTDSRAEDLVDRRRHSVSVCETPQRRKVRWGGESRAISVIDFFCWQPDSIGRQRKIYVTASSTSSSSAATSGSATPTSGRATPVADLQRGYSINTPQMHASLQSELLKSVRTSLYSCSFA